MRTHPQEPRRAVTRWWVPAALYAAVTLVLTYPLLTHIASAFPHDGGDPALNTWLLWWNTERVPFTSAWWNAPMFFPASRTLALSEVLLGLLPITAPVQWLSGSPLLAYNAAFLLSFPLCALAAYALALEVTERRDAAFLAGLAYAFAPYRIGQLSHIQVLSYYFAPIVFLALHRYRRTGRRTWLGIFAASWLFQSLSNGYSIFHLGVFIALWMVWFARSLRDALAIVSAWAIGSLPLAPILLGYRSVHSSLHLTRDINEIKRFGADLGDFLTASADVRFWGERLWAARPETALFPGATMLVIGGLALWAYWRDGGAGATPPARDQRIWVAISAIAALVALSALTFGPWRVGPLTVTDYHKPFSIAVGARLLAWIRGPWMRRAWTSRSLPAFYLVLVLAAYVLALGPEPRLFGRPILYEPPYAWLMRLPGFETLRVPARFAMIAVLGQSVLIAIAATRLNMLARRPIVIALIAFGLLVDGWFVLPVAAAPRSGPADWGQAAVVVELPAGGNHEFDALYRSMFHRKPIANGYSGYYPPHYLPFVLAMQNRRFDAVSMLPAPGPIAVAVDLLAPDSRDIAAAVATLPGVERGPSEEGWATFLVTPSASQPIRVGPEAAGITLRASRNEQDVRRMLDRDITTAWAPGSSQVGDEEITLSLTSPRQVGAVVIDMGAFAFGYPRRLTVDASLDGGTWSTVWEGETGLLALRAAIDVPEVVPLTIDLGSVSARHLRLRQTGSDPGPWWIAELHVHAPQAGR